MRFTNKSKDKTVRVEVYAEAQMDASHLRARANDVGPDTTVTLNPHPDDEKSGYIVVVLSQQGHHSLASGPGRVRTGATVTFTGKNTLQVS